MSNVEKREITKSLPVILTDEERLNLGAAMAKSSQDRNRAEDRKKEASAQFKAEIEKYTAEISRAGALLSNGYEYRDVKCELILDFDNGIARTIRTDTGVVVDERAIRTEEMQARMEFDKAHPVDGGEYGETEDTFPGGDEDDPREDR